jgi:hypothetical protein
MYTSLNMILIKRENPGLNGEGAVALSPLLAPTAVLGIECNI